MPGRSPSSRPDPGWLAEADLPPSGQPPAQAVLQQIPAVAAFHPSWAVQVAELRAPQQSLPSGAAQAGAPPPCPSVAPEGQAARSSGPWPSAAGERRMQLRRGRVRPRLRRRLGRAGPWTTCRFRPPNDCQSRAAFCEEAPEEARRATHDWHHHLREDAWACGHRRLEDYRPFRHHLGLREEEEVHWIVREEEEERRATTVARQERPREELAAEQAAARTTGLSGLWLLRRERGTGLSTRGGHDPPEGTDQRALLSPCWLGPDAPSSAGVSLRWRVDPPDSRKCRFFRGRAVRRCPCTGRRSTRRIREDPHHAGDSGYAEGRRAVPDHSRSGLRDECGGRAR